MNHDRERSRLGYHGGPSGPGGPSFLAKVLAVTTGTLLLIGAVAISIVLFAVVATGLLIFGLYLWWKTRAFRKQLQEAAMHAAAARAAEQNAWPPPEGDIIEGEVIRETSQDEKKNP